jgi:excisionase family DNA binding protein
MVGSEINNPVFDARLTREVARGAGMVGDNPGSSLQSELLTVKEAADYLRVSRVTAWRWCQQGVIPAFRIGRSWRIRREALLSLEDNFDADHHGLNLAED